MKVGHVASGQLPEIIIEDSFKLRNFCQKFRAFKKNRFKHRYVLFYDGKANLGMYLVHVFFIFAAMCEFK